ncbi:GNAT superfamily N-acetyltransferase [Leifsonia soli]|uniref:GNAT superfamily N-acetyltransferase n=2 Tax=Leifsonia soli TaxID=582665 RepID=A0A852SUN8_9MICO|nr:GNAT family N-acetyltransferase [Leifsonia soli]NYD72491.1 GNAT superfamily N-acetyltransferase [Leifsonia soli]
MSEMTDTPHIDVALSPASTDDLPDLGRRLQTAFALALKDDPHHRPDDEPIPSDRELRECFDAPESEVLHVTANGERVGGMVLRIDPADHRNGLELFFIDPEHHSLGLGRRAWSAAERRHPETRVWETMTPHFETRNIHFYVNVCGFDIVEFFNPYHPEPDRPADDPRKSGEDDLMFRFEKVMGPDDGSDARR